MKSIAALCFGLLFLGIIIGIVKEHPNPPPAPIVSTTPTDTIPYAVIGRWTNHTDGKGRVLVISPKYRNEESLRLLAGQIAAGSADKRAATVMVFDNRRAATMFHHIPNDSAASALYIAHLVGAYVKNDAAKMNGFNIMLDGIGGPSTMVQFTTPEEPPQQTEAEPEDATTPKRFTGRLGPNAVFTSEAAMHAAMQLIINHVADSESLAPYLACMPATGDELSSLGRGVLPFSSAGGVRQMDRMRGMDI